MLSPLNRTTGEVKHSKSVRRSLGPARFSDHWPQPQRSGLGPLGIVAIVCAVLAAVASTSVGLLLVTRLQTPPLAKAVAELNRLAQNSTAPTPTPKPQTPSPPPQPVAVVARVAPPPVQLVAPPPVQLVVTPAAAARADEVRRLNVALSRASDGANVVIGGLPLGAKISAGQSTGGKSWRLPATELATADLTPPPGFVGNMDLLLELRLADDSVVDRKNLQLTWAARPPEASRFLERRLGVEEIAALNERGRDFIAKGDLAAARALFQRAAEARDAEAAFALAETYDPAALQRLGEQGLAADAALAETWYARAKELGSRDAALRLQALERHNR